MVSVHAKFFIKLAQIPFFSFDLERRPIMKKARSLKKELIYSFLSIAFFSIAILGVFQIYQLSSLTKENQRYQAQTAKYLADYIDNYILDYKKAIQTEALNVKEPFLNNDIPGIQKQLKDIKTN